MDLYLAFVFIPFGFALIDFIFKGIKPYETLPPFMKGWGWHIGYASIYALVIVLMALSLGNWWALVGILGIANEDLFFYVFASLYHKKWLWNNWLFKTQAQYYSVVAGANVLMFLIVFLSQYL